MDKPKKNQQQKTFCCECCGEQIKQGEEKTHEFLTGFFGYVYCSDECMLAHINSK